MKRLLFLTPNPIESASERYRIFQFLPYLEGAGYACAVRPFAHRALHRAIQSERLAPRLFYTPLSYVRRAFELSEVSHYDAVIVHRGIFPFPWPSVETAVIRRHGKVLFDFDDAIHIGHRDTAAAKYSWVYKLKYGPGVNALLRSCQHVIAGNRTLADFALQLNPRVSIIPTVVDLQRYRYQPPRAAAQPITVGWVGSRSTSPYLVEIEPVLRRLAAAHPGKIAFRFYGHPQRKLDLPNCESLPFSLASEIEDLRRIDIGLMPIPDNDWTRGKCAFKSIQYMALGIPTVSSTVGMATEVVQHNENGFLARTSDEWFYALDQLVAHAELRRRFGEEGRKTVEANYSLQLWAPRFVDLVDQVLAGKVPDLRCASAERTGLTTA